METTTAQDILAYNKWLDTVENKEQFTAIELLDLFTQERDTVATAEEPKIQTCADCAYFRPDVNGCGEKTSGRYGGRVIPSMKACIRFKGA